MSLEKTIVVAGDVTIDWFYWDHKFKQETEGQAYPNWKSIGGMKTTQLPGGAKLLADFIDSAMGQYATVRSCKLDNTHLDEYPASEIIRSLVKLIEIEKHNLGGFRIISNHGYDGPISDELVPRDIIDDDPEAFLVVLDDAGNGFCNKMGKWPISLTQGKTPLVIYKIVRKPFKGELWKTLWKDHKKRMVVVISADDLRDFGVNICRRLSWERTGESFAFEIENNQNLKDLRECRNLIVRFDMDGAIHYSWNDGRPFSKLIYDPRGIEGNFREKIPYNMQGISNAFVTGLARKLLDTTPESIPVQVIENGIASGINIARELFRLGLGSQDGKPYYPCEKIFSEEVETKNKLSPARKVPVDSAFLLVDKSKWTLLEEIETGIHSPDDDQETRELKKRKKMHKCAITVVEKGSEKNFNNVPMAEYGNLKIVDRTEIESFRTIDNLLRKYLSDETQKKPISIAVFGQPGSGKSFGVKQLMAAIAGKKIDDRILTFNVSQFTSPEDINRSLRKVQNLILKGEIPLVFFDEFDSAIGNTSLAWLKFFLMPMQDGEFICDGETNKIGKAIFVFAGGTSHAFEKFAPPKPSGDPNSEEYKEMDKLWVSFVSAKGPDFLSRLKGYINIMGPNPLNNDDKMFIIRRAVILRSMLMPHLGDRFISTNGEAKIDSSVITALLRVPEYRHGIRSIESIFKMSNLEYVKTFSQACIPPKDQLEMHVDAETFIRWMTRENLFGDSVDDIAKHIHESYCESIEKNITELDEKLKESSDEETKRKLLEEKTENVNKPNRIPWSELKEDIQESNFRQMDDIPVKLRIAECEIIKKVSKKDEEEDFVESNPIKQVSEKDEEVDFVESNPIVQKLAEMEHERWMREKFSKGWKYADKRNDDLKHHDLLKPWKDLKESDKKLDIDAVIQIPDHLKAGGFIIRKINSDKKK